MTYKFLLKQIQKMTTKELNQNVFLRVANNRIAKPWGTTVMPVEQIKQSPTDLFLDEESGSMSDIKNNGKLLIRKGQSILEIL